MFQITCFGEVLWDELPTGKKVGGAPLNVAFRMRSLGNDTHIISSIGSDANGEELEELIKGLSMPTYLIQHHEELETSRVQVELDASGSASYTIKYPCAWDDIKATPEAIEMVQTSDAFIFGSLASRDPRTKVALNTLLAKAQFKVFDVNLRAPHYTMELIDALAQQSNFIKFNDDEILEYCEHFGLKHNSMEEAIRLVAEKTSTDYLCVTLGEKGAILCHEGQLYSNGGYKIEVVDTVGAGDSFLASLISKLLQKVDPQEVVDFACAIGAMVAASAGANPTFTDEQVKAFIASYA